MILIYKRNLFCYFSFQLDIAPTTEARPSVHLPLQRSNRWPGSLGLP